MYRKTTPFALLAVVGIAASACLDDSITGSRTLGVQLTTAATAVETGETLTATVSAMGTGLQGLVVDWGDGVVDSLSLTGLVVTVENDFDHDYSAEGTYSIVATAEDQTGSISDSTTVDVTVAPAR